MHTIRYWVRIAEKNGTVIWYKGVMVHENVQSMTVGATLRMFVESDTWDVYVGAAEYIHDVQAVNMLFRTRQILATFVSLLFKQTC